MSGYKRFAIAGATGTLGTHLLQAWENSGRKFEVIILTRKTGGRQQFAQDWAKKGAEIREVDYEDEESLVSGLTGADVVISTLGMAALGLQTPLAKAASKAGAKLYVNGHWGSPLTGAEVPALAGLDAIRTQPIKVAEELGLPWAEFQTSSFLDMYDAIPLVGFHELKNRNATVYGDGNARNSWTTQWDVARYVWYVLLNLPPSKLRNRSFKIEGDAKSPNEIIKIYEEKHPGPPVEITHAPVSVLEDLAKSEDQHQRIIAVLVLALLTGKGKHKDETLDNNEYPGWNPKTFADIL